MALRSLDHQTALPGLCRVRDTVARVAGAGIKRSGAVFARRGVMDFILDLTGYTAKL